MRDGSPRDLVQFDIKRVFTKGVADLLFNTNISTRKNGKFVLHAGGVVPNEGNFSLSSLLAAAGAMIFVALTRANLFRASTCIKEAEYRKSLRRTRKARIFINIFS